MGHLLSIATKVRHGRWDHTPSVRMLERKILQYGGGVSSRHLLPIATKERSLIAGALIVDVSHRDKIKSLVWVPIVVRFPCSLSIFAIARRGARRDTLHVPVTDGAVRKGSTASFSPSVLCPPAALFGIGVLTG